METHATKLNSALESFFVICLKEMYWSEMHMPRILKTMMEEAKSNKLKQAFEQHSEQTAMHEKALEKVFTLLELPSKAEPNVGLQGLFDEARQVIEETEKGTAQRDVALIIADQKMEHYEIASYGSLISLAKTLGHKKIVQLLKPVLKQEKEMDDILSSIAESKINIKASEEPAKHGAIY